MISKGGLNKSANLLAFEVVPVAAVGLLKEGESAEGEPVKDRLGESRRFKKSDTDPVVESP